MVSAISRMIEGFGIHTAQIKYGWPSSKHSRMIRRLPSRRLLGA